MKSIAHAWYLPKRGERTQLAHDAQMDNGGRTRMRTQKRRLHAHGGITWLNTRCSTASIILSAGVIMWEQTHEANLSWALIWSVKMEVQRECHSESCLLMQMQTV
jgi:hypothetical protein